MLHQSVSFKQPITQNAIVCRDMYFQSPNLRLLAARINLPRDKAVFYAKVDNRLLCLRTER